MNFREIRPTMTSPVHVDWGLCSYCGFPLEVCVCELLTGGYICPHRTLNKLQDDVYECFHCRKKFKVTEVI